MPVANAEATNTQELIEAYRTLDLELGASPSAIRMRYRELAQLHHPDKHPHGSPAQAAAAARMAQINAAYELIQDAPLKDYRPEVTSIDAEAPPDRGLDLERPAPLLAETLVRMVLGAVLGLLLAVILERRGVPGFWLYVWFCPALLAFAFADSSPTTAALRNEIVDWIWFRK